MTPEELKTYTELAKPFVELLVTKILKPNLSKIGGWLKKKSIESNVVESYYENKFTDYINRTYSNCSIINTLVFPNQQIKIKDIYLPLTIVSTKDNERFTIGDKLNYETFFKI